MKKKINCPTCGGSGSVAKSKLVSAFGVAAERIRELVEADKAGRLMVLPESKEHQRKTRQDVFLEQWPEVKLFDGIIDIKPCDLVASLRSECPKTFCYECRHKFWMQEWSDG